MGHAENSLTEKVSMIFRPSSEPGGCSKTRNTSRAREVGGAAEWIVDQIPQHGASHAARLVSCSDQGDIPWSEKSMQRLSFRTQNVVGGIGECRRFTFHERILSPNMRN